MKRTIIAATAISWLLLASHASTPVAANEVTITGEGACAKCVLKEAGAKQCQITVTAEAGGKNTVYYLVQNDATQGLGHQLCIKRHNVKATGTVAVVDGKTELTPTSIRLVDQ